MVVTKIEAGEYSIVTASGLKFNAMKQRNHYWTVQNDRLGIIAGYPTLKECEEWAEKQMAEKPVEPVKPEEFTKADESVKTEKADEPKSRVEKLMPDFVNDRIIFNMSTQEVLDLLMKECAKLKLRWLSGAAPMAGYPSIDNTNICVCHTSDGMWCGSKGTCAYEYPSREIVTITLADFDKPKKEFTKADLKTGMVVECRNGIRYMVIEGNYECEYGGDTDLMLIGEGSSWDRGSHYSEGMINSSFAKANIDKVYKRKMQGLGRMLGYVSDEDLIWQRKPEYDWSKAEVDMPILGRHGGDAPWRKRYFAKYENGIVLAWNGGRTSWTTDKTCQWAYALPYKGNEHLVEGE